MYLFVFTLVNASVSFAGPSRTTYQAKIVKPDGYPLESASVNFKFTILDPAGTCILYSETYSSVNMGNTGGLISFSLGSGVKTYPASATTFEQVFSNITANLSCDAGGPVSYSPSANDARKIVMQFHDGSGWQTLPAMNINAVPYAMYANTAQNLNGKTVNDFVQVSTLGTCTASEALTYNGVGFSCLAMPTAQTVSAAAVVSALGYTPANGASVTALSSSVVSANATIATVSSTVYSVSSTVTSLQNSVAASFAAITSSQWITSGTNILYNTGNVAIGGNSTGRRLEVYAAAGNSNVMALRTNDYVLGGSGTTMTFQFGAVSGSTYASINNLANGGVTAYPLVLQTSAAGFVGIGTTTPATKLDVSGGVRIAMDSSACAAGLAGTLRYNSGAVEFCNGTSWSAFGVAGAGITNLNGSTSGSQTFATGTTGTALNISSANGVHTFNIPLASTATVTGGLLSNADYTTFMGKITSSAASIAAVLGYTPASATQLANFLVKANNLSDLSSSATARANLGLGSFATASSIDLGSASATGILDAARLPAHSGDVSSVSGSPVLTLAFVGAGVTSGSQYTKVTVDGKGRVTSGTQLNLGDVTTALGYTPASASASTQWTTSSTSIYYNTGNVGIGTASPANTLSVAGTGYFTNQITVVSSGVRVIDSTQNGGIRSFNTLVLQSDDDNSSTAEDIVFKAGVSEVMRVRETGFVGIGTTNPSAKLEVSGGIITTGGAGTLSLKAGPLVDHTYMQFFARSASPTTRSGYIGYPSSGTNQLNVYNETSTGSIVLGTNGSPRMTVAATGEVVVGAGPLRLTSGTLIGSPTTGSIEYDGFYYYITDSAGVRRSIATVANPGTYDNASVISSTGNISLVPTGSVIVSSTTASTNSSTGALVVNGGLGVAGNIYSSGTIVTSSNITGSEIYATSATITPYIYGSTAANGNLRIESTTNASKGNILIGTGGGKVGIGYASPLAKIHVGGSISGAYRSWMDNGMIVGKSGDSDGGYFGLKDEGVNRQDTVIAWGDDIGDNLRFIFTASGGASDGAEMMRIQANGYVGIGTSAPASLLHVSGTTAINWSNSGNSYGLATIGTNDSTGGSLFVQTPSYNSTSFNSGLGVDGSYNANTSSINLTAYGVKSSPYSSNLIINVTSNSTVREMMRFVGASGYTGIGTGNPQSNLEIVGAHGTQGILRLTSTSDVASGGSSFMRFNDVNGTAGYVGFGGTNNRFDINSYKNGAMVFGTSNTEQMRITNTGNVGIGTSSPNVKLEVKAGSEGQGAPVEAIRIWGPNSPASSNSAQDLTWRFASAGSTGIRSYRGGSWDSYMQFMTTASSAGADNPQVRMHINHDGLVGINMTSPLAQLHVASGPAMTAGYNRVLALHANHPTMVFKGISDTNHSGGIGYDAQSNTEAMRFWVASPTDDVPAAGIQVMTLTASGNVGVGTTAPSEKLEVNGNIKAASYLYTSDERLKKDIITLPDALTKALQLRGVNFVWRNTNEKTVGFIAQEVEKVYPELVKTDKVTGYKAVQYGNIVAILIEALKQEHEERVRSVANVNEQANSRINQLEKENQDLKARLEKIEKFLSEKIK